ncbi:type II toxin-antitoxin system Phd/YefM family antitoxin [Sphingosinicella sp.]|uniref:type II toxin-antitoxin system Phd/YefM family antitoxin n=1 Tax=Sphingosinicella sp. TaxID=1917971 RepID=UPI00262F41EF|nr:type II toxin-antitoxin system prevent-host-death family antitoxin [Sphingosinicella sp.]
MDKTISASTADRHFSRLLRQVAKGESFTIMSRGRPVARVLPIARQEEHHGVEQLLAFVERLPNRHSGSSARLRLYE